MTPKWVSSLTDPATYKGGEEGAEEEEKEDAEEEKEDAEE